MDAGNDSKPGTFWADRRRYAIERTTGMLMTAIKDYTRSTLLVLLGLGIGIGIYLFGQDYLRNNFQGITVELTTLLLTVVLATASGCILFLAYYINAPSKLWKRDQRLIAGLEQQLAPKAQLSFIAGECVRHVPEGSVSIADSGKRWFDQTGHSRQVFVKCSNLSSANIEDVNVKITGFRKDSKSHPSFFSPITLRQNFPIGAGVFEYCSVLVHADQIDRPYINAENLLSM